MADRAFVLGRLQHELRAARDVHADAYAAELEARIARLSAGSPDNPAAEKTAATRPARSKR